MPERVIGQCNTADFKVIEHLVDVYGTPAFDTTTLKRKQVLALALVAGFCAAGLDFKDCFRIREAIFWEHHIEFRFFHGQESQALKAKLSDYKVSSTIQIRMADVLKGGQHETT